MLLQVSTLFLVLAITKGLPNPNEPSKEQPNTAGKNWTSKEVKVIRLKLRVIWDNAIEITKQFDPIDPIPTEKLTNENDKESYEFDHSKSKPEDVEYLYDPTRSQSIPDCKNTSHRICQNFWGPPRRSEDMAFNERKMLRLAFHDCVPYEDKDKNGKLTGGCDGCLNLDEDLEHNNGLQFTVAVLEKLYTEVNFPEHKMFKNFNLEKSPKDLNISRADLWAFAGLVALDEFQQKTKSFCDWDEYGHTCGFTQCYSPFDSEKFQSMFQTGRTDCVPKKGASQKHQYLSDKKEVHPNQHGNGQDSKDYFEKHFGLGPRAGLALLGIHTIAQFNPMTAHMTYSWCKDNDDRNELFNNEYYQTLAEMPYRVTKKCWGKVDGSPAVSKFRVSVRIFPQAWEGQIPYGGPNNPGFLSWKMEYNRTVNCDDPYIDNQRNLFKDDWKLCCHTTGINCRDAPGDTCHKNCTKFVNARARFTSAEAGYYNEFHFDPETGFPQGCKMFDDAFFPGITQEQIENVRHLGHNNCSRQISIKDETNDEPIYKTVEFFAEKDNLQQWQDEFLDAYKIMASNNNENLVTSKHAEFIMSPDSKIHGCLQTFVDIDKKKSKKFKITTPKKIKPRNPLQGLDAVDCQKACLKTKDCNHFLFDEVEETCRMYKEIVDRQTGSRFNVYGTRDECLKSE